MLTQNDKATLAGFLEEMEDILGDKEQAIAMAAVMAEIHLENTTSPKEKKKGMAARKFYISEFENHKKMRYC